jgi:hypothetical protein
MGKKLKSGAFAVEVEDLPLLWHDRKRHLGLPWSLTAYSLNSDKLLVNSGLFNLKEDEILLYRIRDISVSESFGERLFGEGTVRISSSDVTLPHLELLHVKNARKVKEVISKCVEESRRKNGIRSTELMNDIVPGLGPEHGRPPVLENGLPDDMPAPDFPDADHDGIDDRLEN